LSESTFVVVFLLHKDSSAKAKSKHKRELPNKKNNYLAQLKNDLRFKAFGSLLNSEDIAHQG
jgi:hypothetical protein